MFGGGKKLVDRQNSRVRRKLEFGYEVRFFGGRFKWSGMN
jgi:hypothetical protein